MHHSQLVRRVQQHRDLILGVVFSTTTLYGSSFFLYMSTASGSVVAAGLSAVRHQREGPALQLGSVLSIVFRSAGLLNAVRAVKTYFTHMLG